MNFILFLIISTIIFYTLLKYNTYDERNNLGYDKKILFYSALLPIMLYIFHYYYYMPTNSLIKHNSSISDSNTELMSATYPSFTYSSE
jgi:hypothetical protein